MKKSIIILFLLALILVLSLSLVACDEEKSMDDQTKVIFEMEGGSFKNCEGVITHYYPLKDGEQHLIAEPKTLTAGKNDVVKDGYTLQGWFRTKEVQGDKVVYSDQWDFSTDKITSGEGVTLYAYWRRNLSYTYKLCYLDGVSEVELGVYSVDEGDLFSDYLNHRDNRSGYTFLKFVNADGSDWDASFKHPGGESDCEIKVYASFIEGEYSLVSTARELKSSATKGKSIYLLDNIDLEGESLTFKKGYDGIFKGNGFKVSNFKMTYADSRYDLVEDYEDDSKSSLMISLFGETENAVISDVTFENVQLDINTNNNLIYKIYVAPICANGSATLSNVSFSGTYTVSKLPRSFILENGDVNSDLFIVVNDKPFYKGDSTYENCFFSFILKADEEE